MEVISNDLQIKNYKAGDIVIKKNQQKNSTLFIILEGNLKHASTGHIFADKGKCIGDEWIIQQESVEEFYDADLIAAVDMKVGEMTRYQFEVSICGKYEDVVKENAAITVLRKVELFRHLTIFEMQKLRNDNP